MKTVQNSLGFRIERLMKYLRLSQTMTGQTIFQGRTRQYVASILRDERSPTALELKFLAILFRLPDFDIKYLIDPKEYLAMGRFKIAGEEKCDPYNPLTK